MYLLPSLPYAHDALQPVIGAQTMLAHHGSHHARHVQAVNELADGARHSLEGLIGRALVRGDAQLFEHAAQAWNHAFFWQSMSPAACAPEGVLRDAIDASFGGLPGLRREFLARGMAQAGSGWVWLVVDGGLLEVVTTHDSEVPWLKDTRLPLLACDVWEHAYYLDYRNERGHYLAAWFDGIANWSFAGAQLGGGAYRYPPPG